MQNIQRLIEAGLASPNDVNTDGWTVLHCAAAGHHAELCRMLIDIGAVTDAVTERHDTPLLLATKKVPLGSRWENRRQGRGEADSLNTVRILVEHGKNDPMQCDDIGFNSMLSAARDSCNETMSWLLNQNEFVIDLRCETPAGYSAAAYITTREDFSPSLLADSVKNGVEPGSPCVNHWHFRYGPKFPKLGGVSYPSHLVRPTPKLLLEPSMLQYAVCSWYDRLLNTDDTWFPWKSSDLRELLKIPVSPVRTIKTLLDQGTNINAQSVSGHTILDGLCLNLVQIDGSARRQQHLDSCMETWIGVLQDLGFSSNDYIRHERALHENVELDLGLGLHMELRFDENAAPWIWSVFQGPEEETSRCTLTESTNVPSGQNGIEHIPFPNRYHLIHQRSFYQLVPRLSFSKGMRTRLKPILNLLIQTALFPRQWHLLVP